MLFPQNISIAFSDPHYWSLDKLQILYFADSKYLLTAKMLHFQMFHNHRRLVKLHTKFWLSFNAVTLWDVLTIWYLFLSRNYFMWNYVCSQFSYIFGNRRGFFYVCHNCSILLLVNYSAPYNVILFSPNFQLFLSGEGCYYLDHFQSRFSPGYGTERALIALMDGASIFVLDLSVAFDTINHGILDYLWKLGVDSTVLCWLFLSLWLVPVDIYWERKIKPTISAFWDPIGFNSLSY